jgi:hypothetical protein
MKIMLKITLVAVLCCFCLPMTYSDVAASTQKSATPDKKLAEKHADFENFAHSKVKQLNRNHKLSRSRMLVTKQADGTYLARYHQIDDSSLKVKVMRSKSNTIPFVGIISYKEQILESSAATPKAFNDSQFAVVKIIPNRHIFSYNKGNWN